MSTFTNDLTEAASKHEGTELGKLLQWAALHIASQDEALAELRAECEAEENDPHPLGARGV